MELNELRDRIDATDDEIIKLFIKRMKISESVAQYKKEHNMQIFDGERERLLLDRVEEKAGGEMGGYTRKLFECLMELSKEYQKKNYENAK